MSVQRADEYKQETDLVIEANMPEENPVGEATSKLATPSLLQHRVHNQLQVRRKPSNCCSNAVAKQAEFQRATNR